MSLKDWLSLSISVLNFAFVVWVFVLNRRAATRSEVAARYSLVDAELSRLNTEVALLRQATTCAPTDDDFAQVYTRVNQVADDLGRRIESTHGEVRHVCGLVQGMQNTLDNINQFLLERGK